MKSFAGYFQRGWEGLSSERDDRDWGIQTGLKDIVPKGSTLWQWDLGGVGESSSRCSFGKNISIVLEQTEKERVRKYFYHTSKGLRCTVCHNVVLVTSSFTLLSRMKTIQPVISLNFITDTLRMKTKTVYIEKQEFYFVMIIGHN